MCSFFRTRYNLLMRSSYLQNCIRWVNTNYGPLVSVLESLWKGRSPEPMSSSPSNEKRGKGDYIELLLRKESWRGKHITGRQKLCRGGGESLRFDNSPYWHCVCCGRVSRLRYVVHTVPPQAP